jgi:hypothetical protein
MIHHQITPVHRKNPEVVVTWNEAINAIGAMLLVPWKIWEQFSVSGEDCGQNMVKSMVKCW